MTNIIQVFCVFSIPTWEEILHFTRRNHAG